MKVVVTGATGFVGKYTVKHLKDKGCSIIAMGRDIEKLKQVFDNSVHRIATDYSYDDLIKKMSGVDVIVHLAAKRLQKSLSPLDLTPYIQDNIIITQNLLKVAQDLNIGRFCLASTIGVYSQKNTLPFKEDMFPFPISIYGVSKLACENLANFTESRTSVKVTNLRFSSLYGVGEKEGVIFTDYINRARTKKQIEVWGKGETSLDLLYVKDAVLAIEKAIIPDSISGTYNIGSGNSYSVKQLAHIINESFENKGNMIFLENKKEGGYKIFMDISKAQSCLNWDAFWTLKDSLIDMKKSYDVNG